MDSVNSATVASASSASLGTVQGVAGVLVLKKSMDQQASAVAQLIAALPQVTLATSGSLGTRVNTFA